MRYSQLTFAALLVSTTLAWAQMPGQSAPGVLLLYHGGAVEGDIEHLGDKFRVRRAGVSMMVPAKQVVAQAPTMAGIYQILLKRTNLKEPLPRVELARWCQTNGLSAESIAEAEAALALRPRDRTLMDFRDQMIAAAELKKRAPVTILPALPPPEPATELPSASESLLLDLSPEVRAVFVTKVQPLLMNVCAKCHAEQTTNPYRLTRTLTGASRASQANLAATMNYLDRANPGDSKLLTVAVTVHGDSGYPPIKDRTTPAYRNLEFWVYRAAGQTSPPAPVLASVTSKSKDMDPRLEPEPKTVPPDPVITNTGMPDPRPPAVFVEPQRVKKPFPPLPTINEKTKFEPGDPFDPAEFNGERKK